MEKQQREDPHMVYNNYLLSKNLGNQSFVGSDECGSMK